MFNCEYFETEIVCTSGLPGDKASTKIIYTWINIHKANRQ